MEQFVLVSPSVNNNKSLNTQSFTQQEPTKLQSEHESTDQIDSVKQETCLPEETL